MLWNDVPGVTVIDGVATLPTEPRTVVATLAEALAGARQGVLRLDPLVVAVQRQVGGERRRIAGLALWMPQSHVARWESERLSVLPGTHLQDMAFRFSAWAGGQGVAPDHVDALKRYVREIMRLATAHPDALRRGSKVPLDSRRWLEANISEEEPAPPGEGDELTQKLRRLLASLDRSFLERRTHIRATMLALLAGQHALLLGPPGTAKSMLARSLCSCFEDARYFEYLLSRFTHPDELFGPVSIPGLKEEDYRRLTVGFLPQAHVAFLDEIFKANSAILNSLLTLVNERIFHHGRHRDPAPLIGMIGASNELPDPQGGLAALYDRFLVRLSVPPLATAEAFVAVATGDVPKPVIDPADRITLDDLVALRERAQAVTLDASLREALASLWGASIEKDWPVSDRRWRQAVWLLRVAAAADGRDHVLAIDLLLLEPCLGWDPADTYEVREVLLEHLQPAETPGNDLESQWMLLYSDRVAPTPEQPMPPGDPPPDWRRRMDRRRSAVERFLWYHGRAVRQLAMERQDLDDIGDAHMWLHGLPAELLSPHIQASRSLASVLRRAEAYRADLMDARSLVDCIIGLLPTEDRIMPAQMDLVLGLGDDVAIGVAYRQWRLIANPYAGPYVLDLGPERFLDWLSGKTQTRKLIAGLPIRQQRELERYLEGLHSLLSPHVIPPPGDFGASTN